MSKLVHLFTISILLATLILPIPMAQAQGANNQIFGACPKKGQSSPVGNSPICKTPDTTEDPAVHIINVAANIVATLAGIAAIITIIISGLTMITSGGNQESVTNARKHLVAALIGLVIVALAWVITRFVVDRLLA